MRTYLPALLSFLLLPALISQPGPLADEKDKTKDQPAAQKPKEEEPGFVSLFDGKTLAGWKGRSENWSVREGSIAGSTKPKGIDFNTFLISEKEYGNFHLKVLFKFSGGNSGIQFRSRQVGDPQRFLVSGYQADIGDGYFGAIYDEARRNRLLCTPDKAVVQKAFKKDDWNLYEIRVCGKDIELILNGVTTAKYSEKEKDIAEKGVLALQLHGGHPMEVLFRDIRIRELPPPEPKS